MMEKEPQRVTKKTLENELYRKFMRNLQLFFLAEGYRETQIKINKFQRKNDIKETKEK